jgi:hypothetical protein
MEESREAAEAALASLEECPCFGLRDAHIV